MTETLALTAFSVILLGCALRVAAIAADWDRATIILAIHQLKRRLKP